MLAWVVGGAAAMLFMGLALHQEMADFPGGPQALAASVTPAAEAMRVLRWPAEHLETLGGYLTFHNVMLFSGFLALYAALQGARLVRGPEERHALEVMLATGWSRPSLMRDRVIGFTLVLAMSCAGIAAGIAWALAAGDAPDVSGSVITMASVGLGSFVAFALGLLASQLTRSARTAGGVSASILVAMYLANNAVDEGDAWGWLAYLTPFFWVNKSRALVPGHDLDPGAMLILLAAAVLLIGLAMLAFNRRDYGAGLWTAHVHAESSSVEQPIHWWFRAPWLASLHEHRIGLLAWVAAATSFSALMMALQPAAMDVFEQFSYYLGMVGGAGATPEVMYAVFATDIIAPIVTAYVITQAAGWIADLEQGRVEALLASPMSWTRLVWERLLTAGVGVLAITGTCLATIWIGSLIVGSDVSAPAIGRVAVMSMLISAAVGSLATIAAAALRSTIAVTALAVYVGAAYLLTWMIPMFGWPAWTERLSIFAAFGHPYREWPGVGSIALLLGVAILGSIAGAAIAERTPKVA